MGKGKKGDKITRPSEVKPGRKRGFGGQSRSPNHPFRTISSVTSQKTKANNQDSENKPNPCVPSVTWEGDSPSEKSLSWQAVSRAALAEGDVRVHGLKKKVVPGVEAWVFPVGGTEVPRLPTGQSELLLEQVAYGEGWPQRLELEE